MEKPPALPPTRESSEEDVIDGKYRLLRKLGAGSAGRVYEAEHLALGKRVAIKLLYPRIAEDLTLRTRFLAEARAAGGIAHANVVEVSDFGATADGKPYLVMELLQGETLEALLARREALSPAHTCELMMQVLAGLGAAHRLGIVHRSLRPANIVVTMPRHDSPLVKVLDFGIGQGMLDPHMRGDNAPGAPLYSAPEQLLKQPIDERADVYVAGVILFQMLAGEDPFVGTSAEIAHKMLEGKSRPLASINPAVPRALIQAVATAMKVDREQRFRSAHELGRHLTPYLSHPPPHAVPVSSGSPEALLRGTSGQMPEIRLMSDAPGSRPPRDFPSFDLAKVAGKPRGEPLSDSLLRAPIFPKAPGAPKIQLSSAIRDVERWSDVPKADADLPDTDKPPAADGDDRPAGVGALLAWLRARR